MAKLTSIMSFIIVAQLSFTNFTHTTNYSKISMLHKGKDRIFHLYDPNPLLKNKSLVVVLHGGGISVKAFLKHFNIQGLFNNGNTAVAYPQGFRSQWNDGRDAQQNLLTDDVSFIRDLTKFLISNRGVEPKKTTLVGVSNGAMMAFRIICEQSSMFHTYIAMLGSMPKNLLAACKVDSSFKLLMLGSIKDPIIPYAGGSVSGLFENHGEVDSFLNTFHFVAKLNNCSPFYSISPLQNKSQIDIYRYDNCPNESLIEHYEVKNAGHTWPEGPQYLPKWLIGPVNHDIHWLDILAKFTKRSMDSK